MAVASMTNKKNGMAFFDAKFGRGLNIKSGREAYVIIIDSLGDTGLNLV